MHWSKCHWVQCVTVFPCEKENLSEFELDYFDPVDAPHPPHNGEDIADDEDMPELLPITRQVTPEDGLPPAPPAPPGAPSPPRSDAPMPVPTGSERTRTRTPVSTRQGASPVPTPWTAPVPAMPQPLLPPAPPPWTPSPTATNSDRSRTTRGGPSPTPTLPYDDYVPRTPDKRQAPNTSSTVRREHTPKHARFEDFDPKKDHIPPTPTNTNDSQQTIEYPEIVPDPNASSSNQHQTELPYTEDGHDDDDDDIEALFVGLYRRGPVLLTNWSLTSGYAELLEQHSHFFAQGSPQCQDRMPESLGEYSTDFEIEVWPDSAKFLSGVPQLQHDEVLV